MFTSLTAHEIERLRERTPLQAPEFAPLLTLFAANNATSEETAYDILVAVKQQLPVAEAAHAAKLRDWVVYRERQREMDENVTKDAPEVIKVAKIPAGGSPPGSPPAVPQDAPPVAPAPVDPPVTDSINEPQQQLNQPLKEAEVLDDVDWGHEENDSFTYEDDNSY